jgi:hypothetical protein
LGPKGNEGRGIRKAQTSSLIENNEDLVINFFVAGNFAVEKMVVALLDPLTRLILPEQVDTRSFIFVIFCFSSLSF